MVTSSNIRPGGASVEIVADGCKLDTGLREAESKLRAYHQWARLLNKEATARADLCLCWPGQVRPLNAR